MTHPFAEVRDYAGLHAALRARCIALGAKMETYDTVAGLPDGQFSKFLKPVPLKSIGKESLGPMLGALGLKLLVVEDLEALAKIQNRLVQSKRKCYVGDASDGMLPMKRYKRRYLFKNNKAWSVVLNGRRSLLMTPRQRSAVARKAARARWARRSMGGSSKVKQGSVPA